MRTREISPDFTIEDIHAVRVDFYERTKDMSSEDFVAYCQTLGQEAEREIAKRRALRLASTPKGGAS